ncbi:hypothetical protein ES703_87460 [subsurface metagenome]
MKRILGIVIVVTLLFLVGCDLWGKKGDTGATGSSGQDALISSNSYQFTATANPHVEIISEIDAVGLEAGWQTVTVWMWLDPVWIELPWTVGDGTTIEIDFIAVVGDGGVQVEVFENAVYNEPPLGGYEDYMVTVQTFNH